MACPKGCINGFGQIKHPNHAKNKELSAKILEIMQTKTEFKQEISLKSDGFDGFIKEHEKEFLT